MTESDQLEQYIKDISNYNLLTADEELNICKIIRSTKKTVKDKEKARINLIHGNLRLVIKMARDYYTGNGPSLMDLVAAGNLGLITASEKFNPSKYKNKFSTYSSYWIHNYIMKEIQKHNRFLYIPAYLQDKISQRHRLSCEPVSDEDCMGAMGINEKTLTKIKEATVMKIPLDAPVRIDKRDQKYVHEIIEDKNAIHPSILAERNEFKENIMQAIEQLDDVAKDILMSYFFSDTKPTYRKIAQKYGVSGQRIEQINRKTLRVLKDILIRDNESLPLALDKKYVDDYLSNNVVPMKKTKRKMKVVEPYLS